MTESEWQDFRDRLAELWPDRINAAQAAVWKAYIIKHPAHECASALNEYFASAKNPSDGPQPSLAGFRRCMRVKRESERKAATVPGRLPSRAIWRGFVGEVMGSAPESRLRAIHHQWLDARQAEGKDAVLFEDALETARGALSESTYQ